MNRPFTRRTARVALTALVVAAVLSVSWSQLRHSGARRETNRTVEQPAVSTTVPEPPPSSAPPTGRDTNPGQLRPAPGQPELDASVAAVREAATDPGTGGAQNFVRAYLGMVEVAASMPDPPAEAAQRTVSDPATAEQMVTANRIDRARLTRYHSVTDVITDVVPLADRTTMIGPNRATVATWVMLVVALPGAAPVATWQTRTVEVVRPADRWLVHGDQGTDGPVPVIDPRARIGTAEEFSRRLAGFHPVNNQGVAP